MADDLELNDIIIMQHARAIAEEMADTGAQLPLFPETESVSVSVLTDLSQLGLDIQDKIRKMNGGQEQE